VQQHVALQLFYLYKINFPDDLVLSDKEQLQGSYIGAPQ
jgi:hypothetical protein